MKPAVGDSAALGSDTTGYGCEGDGGDPGGPRDAFRRELGDDPANHALSGRMSREGALYAPTASGDLVETIARTGGVL